MSLDVNLINTITETITCNCGEVHIISQKQDYVFEANITHNLGKMAAEAGIYEALWRPEEIMVTTGGQLIKLLKEGIIKMQQNPEHYKQFDAPNGWGTYDQFLPWITNYLNACIENPESTISVSR